MKSVWILTSEAPDNEQHVNRDALISEGTLGGQYENIKLFDEFKSRNFNVSIMDPSKIFIDKNLPDIALIRTTNGNSVKTLQLLKKLNVKCVNDIDAHLTYADKPKQLEILNKHGVKIPKTKIIDIPFDENELNDITLPIVVKPISSQRGELVKLCQTVDDIYIHCKKIQIRFPKQRKAIFQEFIEGPIIVAWVIGKNPIDAQIRYAKSDNDFFISNSRSDGIRHSYKITDELKHIIIKAVTALNIDIAKIDIFKSINGYMICEVNSPGGFSGRDEYLSTNHANDIVTYISGMLS